MIIVDSSVWIDYFRDRTTAQVRRLDSLFDLGVLAVGDLTITEILQGTNRDSDFQAALDTLSRFPVLMIGGRAIALQAARNYRMLRGRGITIRKTIDTLIATRCIADGHYLLYSGRDFEPFVAHLGLRSALE